MDIRNNMKKITLKYLNLTVNDFKINFHSEEIITENFAPRLSISTEINGVKYPIIAKITQDQIILNFVSYGLDVKKEIEESLKFEAIDWYINTPKYIRKLKLEQLKK